MKAIRWALWNGAMVSLLWAGLAMDMAGPRNVGLFVVWYFAIISLGTFSNEVRKRCAANPEWPSTPGWVDGAVDLFIAGLLVWHGRWWAGGAWTIHALLMMVLREKVKETRRQSKDGDAASENNTKGTGR
jgi:hypothetical protein